MLILIAVAAIVAALITLSMLVLRRVVPTNEVHIIQHARKTTSYGKDTGNGNVYYEWPNWLPILGIMKTVLPVSVFQIELKSYDAYDAGRLPFEVDVVAFFRISDSNVAAQRVSGFEQLSEQLLFIVRGAVRTILAAHEIDKIMLERSTFGEAFTKEVEVQLGQWGVVPVKNIELMDIRDGQGNEVVHNIMQKKKSFIEMQSRSEVANNMQIAQVAEIEAQKTVEVQKQTAAQQVGLQNAEREKQVGIAGQKAKQEVKEQERVTAEKDMAILNVQQVTQARITKDVNVVQAEQQKQATILQSEGTLEAKKREAEGIQVAGVARAEAEKAMQMAPISAQITLAKEIGENLSYQSYLTTIKQIEANQAVGIEQAKALTAADVKIISNSGDPVSGVSGVMDLFSSKGGTNMGAMLEGLANSEQGKNLIAKFTGKKND